MKGAILLVEDSEDDIELTRRALKKNNLTNPLVIARNGQEALDRLIGDKASTDPADLPAMILLDLKLPKIDGLEVLRRLRAERRTRLVPIIILTSSREERDLLEGYTNGANSYIRKPVDFEQFSEAVRQLGLYWLVMNEPPPHVI